MSASAASTAAALPARASARTRAARSSPWREISAASSSAAASATRRRSAAAAAACVAGGGEQTRRLRASLFEARLRRRTRRRGRLERPFQLTDGAKHTVDGRLARLAHAAASWRRFRRPAARARLSRMRSSSSRSASTISIASRSCSRRGTTTCSSALTRRVVREISPASRRRLSSDAATSSTRSSNLLEGSSGDVDAWSSSRRARNRGSCARARSDRVPTPPQEPRRRS